jgi:exopolysaccharide production protein ExoQ
MLMKIKHIDSIICFLYLFVTSNSFLNLLFSSSDGSDDSDDSKSLVTLFFFIILYAYLIYKIAPRYKSIFIILKRNLILTNIVILSLLSSAWSGDTLHTFIQSSWHFLTVLFAIYIVYRFSNFHISVLIVNVLFFSAIISLLYYFFLPTVGKHIGDIHDGAIKGVFGQKNALGRHMAVGSIFSFYLFYIMKQRFYFSYFFLFTAILILSKSTTSLVLLIIIILLYFMSKNLVSGRAKYYQKIIFLFVLLFSVFTIVSMIFGFSPEILGKDASLTGRIPLWLTLIDYINSRPLFGYGFNSFWSGSNGFGEEVWSIVKWEPYSSHNGFIDSTLQLGLFGLVLVIIFLYSSIKTSFSLLKIDKIFFIYFLIILFLILMNFTESLFLRKNYFLWLLFLIFHIAGNRYIFMLKGRSIRVKY